MALITVALITAGAIGTLTICASIAHAIARERETHECAHCGHVRAIHNDAGACSICKSWCVKFVSIMTIVLIALPAHAQSSLDTATRVFFTAAAADAATTGIGLARGEITEANPMLQWAHNDSSKVMAASAASDIIGVWALRRFVGRTHPRVATVALYAQAAWRGYLSARTMRHMHLACTCNLPQVKP